MFVVSVRRIELNGVDIELNDIPERRERNQLDHLAKLGQVIGSLLAFLALQTDDISLVDDLEEGIADGRLKEGVVDVGHVDGSAVGNIGYLSRFEGLN